MAQDPVKNLTLVDVIAAFTAAIVALAEVSGPEVKNQLAAKLQETSDAVDPHTPGGVRGTAAVLQLLVSGLHTSPSTAPSRPLIH